MRIAIVCNGTLNGVAFHKRMLHGADVIIAADGGANHAERLGVVPDYVIGDMDSIRPGLLAKLKKNDVTAVITDPDQDKTDAELALELALKLKPREIIFLCAEGRRLDHALANLLLLERVPRPVKASVVDDTSQAILLRERVSLRGTKGDIVSVVPLTPLSGLTYSGLKWGVRSKRTPFGWVGVSNVMTGNVAHISVTRGRALVIRVRE